MFCHLSAFSAREIQQNSIFRAQETNDFEIVNLTRYYTKSTVRA